MIPNKKLFPNLKLTFPLFKITFFNVIVCVKMLGPNVAVTTSIIPLVSATPFSPFHIWATAGVLGVVVLQK